MTQHQIIGGAGIKVLPMPFHLSYNASNLQHEVDAEDVPATPSSSPAIC
jgi:hypothetical protein